MYSDRKDLSKQQTPRRKNNNILHNLYNRQNIKMQTKIIGQKLRQVPFRCTYCNNKPDGIIYKPKDSLKNVYSCYKHATNLFIPFSKSIQQQSVSLKSSQIKKNHQIKQKQHQEILINNNNPNVSHRSHQIASPQPFFQHLMSTLISQFNLMKKQVMSNYYSIISLPANQQSLQFQFQGDISYPYMLINNDNNMLMNHFVNRLLMKRQQENMRIKQEEIIRRRKQVIERFNQNQNDKQKIKKQFDQNKLIAFRNIRSLEKSPNSNWNSTIKGQNSPDKSFLINQKTNYTSNNMRKFTMTERRPEKNINNKYQ